MRRWIISALLLSLCASALAQDYGATNFKIERWDEDYSYLKDSPRTDFFDPAKYIPLNQSGDTYLSFGGQARYRYDYFNNTGFGSGVQDENGFHLFRLLAHVDAHFGQNFRVFVQMNSGLLADRSGGPRPGDADDIDFQQAFADLRVPFKDDASLTFRAGRQELIYGAQRLISPNDWGNVRRTFDGAKASLSLPNDTLDVFWTRPVEISKPHLNSNVENTAFAGIYNVAALPRLIPSGDTKVDLYALGLNQSRTAEMAHGAGIYTFGSRFHTTPAPWDVDIEADWQTGRANGRYLNAYAFAAEGGYTFPCTTVTPRAALGFDLASGSADGTNRFHQLFPPQYLYLGHMYVLGRENIIDVHPEFSIGFPHDVTLYAAEHIFWRQNTGDAAYNLNGGVVRAPNGSTAAYIGNEFDISVTWQIQRNLFWYAGYAHFFAGTFINETGPHQDMDFAYTAITFTF